MEPCTSLLGTSYLLPLLEPNVNVRSCDMSRQSQPKFYIRGKQAILTRWQLQKRAPDQVSLYCAFIIITSNSGHPHTLQKEETSPHPSTLHCKMSNYHHVLFQFPPFIATIILALIFRKIFYKYLNTARKRSYALRVVAINIGIISLLYVVVRNVVMVAEMRRRHEMGMEGRKVEVGEVKEVMRECLGEVR